MVKQNKSKFLTALIPSASAGLTKPGVSDPALEKAESALC